MQALKAAKEYFEEAEIKSPSALKTLLMITTTQNTVFLQKFKLRKRLRKISRWKMTLCSATSCYLTHANWKVRS